MSPFILPYVYLWTVQFYKRITKQAMEFQEEMTGGLGEASLFPSPTKKDAFLTFSFDDIDTKDQERPQVQPDFLDFNFIDIIDNGWMEQEIDLSKLDPTYDQLPAELLNTENSATLLESFIDTDFLNNISDAFFNESPKEWDSLEDNQMEVSTYDASILPDDPLQLASSIDETVSESSSNASSPRSEECYEKSEPGSSEDYVPIKVLPEVAFFISEEESSSRKRKTSVGKDFSLMRKSKKLPRKSGNSLKKESRRERKKVQNKEAAARYRIKIRQQGKGLAKKVTALEEEQAKLQDTHDKLKTEVSILKSLLREKFKTYGILN